MKTECHLALFAKFWRPGKVKTRLAATLGAQPAAEVYALMLSHLLKQLDNVADRRTVVFYPEESRQEFSELGGRRWQLEPQGPGDLGDKLYQFFSRSLKVQTVGEPAETKRKVVVIGSDCTSLDPQLIERAFDALNRQAVVLGPSSDGGYYLIGMCENIPEIFQGISWSTSTVLVETISVLEKMNIGFETLPEMTDVDEAEDLTKLMNELSLKTDKSKQELLEALRKIIFGTTNVTYQSGTHS